MSTELVYIVVDGESAKLWHQAVFGLARRHNHVMLVPSNIIVVLCAFNSDLCTSDNDQCRPGLQQQWPTSSD